MTKSYPLYSELKQEYKTGMEINDDAWVAYYWNEASREKGSKAGLVFSSGKQFKLMVQLDEAALSHEAEMLWGKRTKHPVNQITL
jgi:hypothetical protein